MSEAGAVREKALRVLQAAVADARGEPGVHVSRARVMEQADISELQEFWRIAEYLAGQGFIAQGVNDYDLFTVTLAGVAAGARY